MHDKDVFPSITSNRVFEIEKSILFIIDMQNFSASPCSSWGKYLLENQLDVFDYYYSQLERVVIPNIKKIVRIFFKNNLPIIFFAVGSYSEKTDFLRSSFSDIPPMAKIGSSEHDIIPDLLPDYNKALIINKISRSPFNSSGIDLILKKQKIKNIVVTGVHTCSCVDLTARHAVDLGYNATIIDDATATFNKNLKEATLLTFKAFFGNVLNTNSLMELFSGKK